MNDSFHSDEESSAFSNLIPKEAKQVNTSIEKNISTLLTKHQKKEKNSNPSKKKKKG